MSDPGTERPEEGEREERWKALTSLILPAVTAARKSLGIDEHVFRSHTFHTAPREFMLWTALDEALKTAAFLMKLDGFLEDGEEIAESPSDAIDRGILALIIEEERLRSRRLCEVIVQLVLFSQQDDEALYRHFLLLRELVGACGFNEDLNEFHGASSDWIAASVEITLEQIHRVEPLVDAAAAWYCHDYRRPARAADWRRLLSSTRSQIRKALPLMSDLERLALGTTYGEAFGYPSSTIHFCPAGSPADEATEKVILGEGTKLALLALCCLRRCHELLGRPSNTHLEQMTRVLDSNAESTRLLALQNVRERISVGDFVLARGYLGQVIEECMSSYGWRSLRVELLAERPLPEIGVDWFRARDVVLLFAKEKLVEGVREKLGDPTAQADDVTLRASALSAWRMGLRDQVQAAQRVRRQ